MAGKNPPPLPPETPGFPSPMAPLASLALLLACRCEGLGRLLQRLTQMPRGVPGREKTGASRAFGGWSFESGEPFPTRQLEENR